MKTMQNITKIIFLIFSIFYFINANGQSPAKMSYQAIIRNSANALVISSPVGMKISILQGSAIGANMYVETQTATTNINGLVSLEIGTGSVVTGNLSLINWGASGPFFIKTETDPTGGTNYTIVGVSQLNTVPYSQFSSNSNFATNSGDSWKRTGNVVDVSTDFIGSTNDVDVIFKRNNVKAGRISGTNTAFGLDALTLNTSVNNTAFGKGALFSNVSGFGNVGIGFNVLNINGGSYNTAIGNLALQNSTGDQNTAIGWRSLENLTAGGGNIGIGRLSNVPSPTSNDQLSIGNVIYGTAMGNTANGKIGIGVTVPTEKLEVAGKTKTTDLQVTNGAGAYKVLTSDASGNATWQSAATSSNANTGFEATATVTQVIANSTVTKVNFGFEATDDANAYNPTTSEWTAPSSGFYHVDASVFVSTIFSGIVFSTLYIRVNGVNRKVYQNTINGGSNVSLSTNLVLNANDIVTIYFNQNSGGNATLLNSATNTMFSAFKVY